MLLFIEKQIYEVVGSSSLLLMVPELFVEGRRRAGGDEVLLSQNYQGVTAGKRRSPHQNIKRG